MPLVSRTFDQLIDFTRTTSATFVGSNGLIQSTPESRNLLTFTQEFDNAAWGKNGTTITANAAVAPDGTSTADKLVETATTGVHSSGRTITTTAVPYTWSCYIKAAERTFAFLYHAQTNASVSIDLATGATGTASSTVAPTASSVTSVGNGWYRVAITVMATAAGNFFGVYAATSLSGSPSYTGDGTSGIYIWGAQLEAVPDANLVLGSELRGSGAVGLVGTATAATYNTSTGAGSVTRVDASNQSLVQWSGLSANPYRVIITCNTGTAIGIRSGNQSGTAAATVTVGNSATVYVTPSAGLVTITSSSGTATFTVTTIREYLGVTGMPSDYTRNFGGLFPPRFDYDPVTLAPRGLLIEEQRTNLVLRSEEFDNASWTRQRSTVTANATTSPDGTADADRLVDDTATGTHRIFQAVAKAASAIAYTASVYVKADTLGFATLRIAGVGEAAYTSVGINLTTGELSALSTLGFTSASAAVSNAGNGWWRLQLTGTSDTTGTITALVGVANSLAANSSYTGTGSGSIYVWGAQLEAGAFATSYIPTVASQVTRTADTTLIQAPNFAPWYNQNAGTFVAEFSALGAVNTNNAVIWSASAGNDDFIRNWIWSGTPGLVRVTVAVDGTSTADMEGPVLSANVPVKSAVAYATDDFSLVVNGGAPAIDNAGAVPADISTLQIGTMVTRNEFLSGHIRSIRYYPVRLSNAQLQALTA